MTLVAATDGSCTSTPSRDGTRCVGPAGAVVALRDITERKARRRSCRGERKTPDQAAELEQQVEEAQR